MSDFKEWKKQQVAKNELIFPQNIGPYLSIDETALSKGELYTIITNKKTKGKKGSIVGIFPGTKVEPIIELILKIHRRERLKVKEITLDMANSMKTIAAQCFPAAIQVTDRFHVQKLAIEALQEIRLKHRWEAIDLENNQIKEAKSKGEKLENIGSLYQEGYIETKRAIIGSIFPEKLEFDGFNYRTTRMNSIASHILLINKGLCKKKPDK